MIEAVTAEKLGRSGRASVDDVAKTREIATAAQVTGVSFRRLRFSNHIVYCSIN